jgi:integrator complex subunit 3
MLLSFIIYSIEIVFQIIPNFYPLLADKVRAGIFSSLRQILEKRVLPTLLPLFDNPKLDRELRTMVREAFKEFCHPPTTEGKFVSVMLVLLHSYVTYITWFFNVDFCL